MPSPCCSQRAGVQTLSDSPPPPWVLTMRRRANAERSPPFGAHNARVANHAQVPFQAGGVHTSPTQPLPHCAHAFPVARARLDMYVHVSHIPSTFAFHASASTIHIRARLTRVSHTMYAEMLHFEHMPTHYAYALSAHAFLTLFM
eukprot:296510-Chlamydomonas_euryale.AAC.3